MEEKKCKHCAMMIPKEAKVCPHCRKKQGTSLAVGCLAIIVIIIFIGIISSIMSTGKKEINVAGADSMDAYIAATRFVKAQLKNPHTANFAAHLASDIKKLSDDTCSVASYVDAKNDFGGEIRNHFIVKMKHVGNKKFRLLDIKMNRE